jgi:hypothetical protein
LHALAVLKQACGIVEIPEELGIGR